MADLEYSESIDINASAHDVYALVSDITRTGEWSPICTSCSWNEPDGGTVGSTFTGHNSTPSRTWQTVSTVVAAEPDHEFAWVVGDGYVRWGYTIDEADSGVRLTESWDFLPDGIAMFHNKFGDRAQEEIEVRRSAAYEGIPATLAAIKRIAEGRGSAPRA